MINYDKKCEKKYEKNMFCNEFSKEINLFTMAYDKGYYYFYLFYLSVC